MTNQYPVLIIILFAFSFGIPTNAQTTVAVTPIKDNTLYETTDGGLSNGAGISLFAGRTSSGSIRRALMMFDVSGMVPSGATIESASLTLNMTKTNAGAGAQTMTLHPVRADWGEGASASSGQGGSGATAQSGDATWLHTFFDTASWATPGGDFDDTASADATVDGLGFYTWTSAAMVNDVQDWLDRPGENFGWILVGNESSPVTTKRFDSRESFFEGNWPTLSITFSTATATENETGIGTFGLSQNFPNPFVGRTAISFSLAASEHVQLKVFDVLGREVASLVNRVEPAGEHEMIFDGSGLVAGIYFYRLSTSTSRHTRTMILLP